MDIFIGANKIASSEFNFIFKKANMLKSKLQIGDHLISTEFKQELIDLTIQPNNLEYIDFAKLSRHSFACSKFLGHLFRPAFLVKNFFNLNVFGLILRKLSIQTQIFLFKKMKMVINKLKIKPVVIVDIEISVEVRS